MQLYIFIAYNLYVSLNPIPLILNIPIVWSQKKVWILYIHHGFGAVFDMNGGRVYIQPFEYLHLVI